MIRLVAADLDGTLLTPEETVTTCTRIALERVSSIFLPVSDAPMLVLYVHKQKFLPSGRLERA
jgi:hypothetical protein